MDFNFSLNKAWGVFLVLFFPAQTLGALEETEKLFFIL